MKPIGKYIAVKQTSEDVKTESGLVLSGEDLNQFRYLKAIVAEVGTDVHTIKKDDVLYFDKTNSFAMIIGGQQYTIIREGDVVAVE